MLRVLLEFIGVKIMPHICIQLRRIRFVQWVQTVFEKENVPYVVRMCA